MYKHILHRLPRKFVRITYESTIDKSLFIVYNMVTEIRKENKTMLWIIFTIWVVFALTCVIAAEITENEIFGFAFIISLPFMFYVPFFFM